MKTYLLTAAGVIFLSVIVSLIIPEGKLNKTIVFVMRMACILVLIQPISGIFKINETAASVPLYDYMYVVKAYSNNQSRELENLILKKFKLESSCNVEIKFEDERFKVESVIVEINSDDKKIIEEIYAYLQKLDYINITVYAKSS